MEKNTENGVIVKTPPKDIPIKGRKNQKKHRRPSLKRFLIKLCLWILLLCLAGFGVYSLYLAVKGEFALQKREAAYALVSRELVRCAELCTVKENYSEIVTVKKTTFFGMAKSYNITRYNGVARAGIADISKAYFEISADSTSIVITIPDCVLLGNDFESFDVFDEYKNLFVPIEVDEVFSEIEKSRDATSKKLIEEGLLEEADSHAKEILTRIFESMGFTEIKIQTFTEKKMKDFVETDWNFKSVFYNFEVPSNFKNIQLSTIMDNTEFAKKR
ncbi:MAG: DUF4230 domain-containing protein [Treponemataceae bacterium]|nr:DUF4230 domain-containing protein [Treponemataceae bacterium]